MGKETRLSSSYSQYPRKAIERDLASALHNISCLLAIYPLPSPLAALLNYHLNRPLDNPGVWCFQRIILLLDDLTHGSLGSAKEYFSDILEDLYRLGKKFNVLTGYASLYMVRAPISALFTVAGCCRDLPEVWKSYVKVSKTNSDLSSRTVFASGVIPANTLHSGSSARTKRESRWCNAHSRPHSLRFD